MNTASDPFLAGLCLGFLIGVFWTLAVALAGQRRAAREEAARLLPIEGEPPTEPATSGGPRAEELNARLSSPAPAGIRAGPALAPQQYAAAPRA